MEYSSKVACLVALAFAMAASIAAPCAAQNLPQDYVDAHNKARADVGVGPVSWDDSVAASAQSYADQQRGDCQVVYSGGQYGGNIFISNDTDSTAADAVNYWVSEKQYYDPGSNTCSAPPSDKTCRIYTQVVWPNTTAIGCARDVCDNGSVFIICNYNPGLPP